MPKTYEQECLEIESARISADLAYQREREILHHKPLFSKSDIEALKGKYFMYTVLWVVGTAVLVVMIMRYWK